MNSTNKPGSYKLRGPQAGINVAMPEDEETPEEVLKSPDGEMSQDNIIQKLQTGDYVGAKKIVNDLLGFIGSDEEKEIIKGVLLQVEDYLKTLEPEKQKEIKAAVMGDSTPGGKTNPKYVMEKMVKLNRYSEFVGKINEQSNPTDLKTLPFEKVLSMFETLVNSLATKTKTPADEQQLNDFRAELTSRRDPNKH